MMDELEELRQGWNRRHVSSEEYVAALHEENARRRALTEATQLECNRLAEDVERLTRERDEASQRVEELEREARLNRTSAEKHYQRAESYCEQAEAAEAKLAKVVEALAGLCGATGDVLRGWDAHSQLAKGFGGMGHNILVEAAAKYSSLSCWIRVRRYYDEACAALAAAKGE